jgi:hypothetical protein
MISNLPIQMDLFDEQEGLEGKLYELYEKTSNREFKSHIRFIKADCLNDAEDKAIEADPAYWKNKSVRQVDINYVWETFEKIHFSYQTCKVILGIDSIIED